jgi:hypothetical protein
MTEKSSRRFETFLIFLFFIVSAIILLFVTGVFHFKAPAGPRLKYGFINTQGRVEIGIIYDSVGDFHQGLATVKKDGQLFVIDRNGQKTDFKAFHYQIDSLPIHHFLSSHTPEEDQKLDHSWAQLGEEQFGKKLFRIRRGKYISKREGEGHTFDFVYTYIDTRYGSKAVLFEEAYPYHDSLALVHAQYNKQWRSPSYFRNWAFINSEGQYICQPLYTEAHSFSEGLAAVGILIMHHGH